MSLGVCLDVDALGLSWGDLPASFLLPEQTFTGHKGAKYSILPLITPPPTHSRVIRSIQTLTDHRAHNK